MAKILQNINGKLVPVTNIANLIAGGGGISEERVITLIQEQLANIKHPTWVGSTDVDPGEGSPAPEDCPEGGLLITDVEDSEASGSLVQLIRQIVNEMLPENLPFVDFIEIDPGEGSPAGNIAEKGLVIVGNAEQDAIDLDQRIRDIVEQYKPSGDGGSTTIINGLTEEQVDAKIAAFKLPVWIIKTDTAPASPPEELANGGVILVGQGDGLPLDERVKRIMSQMRYTIFSNTQPGETAPENLVNGGLYIYHSE